MPSLKINYPCQKAITLFASAATDPNYPVVAGASDLVPEVSKHGELKTNVISLLAFIAGIGLMLIVKVAFD